MRKKVRAEGLKDTYIYWVISQQISFKDKIYIYSSILIINWTFKINPPQCLLDFQILRSKSFP